MASKLTEAELFELYKSVLPKIYNHEVDDTNITTVGQALANMTTKVMDLDLENEMSIDTVSESALFANFGIVVGFVRDQNVNDYRKTLKAIYAAIAKGTTKESITNAVVILSGSSGNAVIYELYNDKDLDALKVKFGSTILGNWENTDLTFKAVIEIPWEDGSPDQMAQNRVNQFISAIKPSHTLFMVLYSQSKSLSDGLKLSDNLTYTTRSPETRAGYAKAGYSEVGA